MYSAYFFIFSIFMSLSWGFKDCGSKDGSVLSVSVSNCEEDQKCVLKKKTNVTIEIVFTNVDSKTVTPEIHGIIGAASIPFPVPNPDGCKDSGITCPVSADQINKYTASFYVEPSYPNIAATVKLELKDDSGKDFFCKLIRGKIK
ncbi:unnamed protein product [Tenebrio molitor]|nr:unnamed protein product [Tenebrio molitor]